MKQTNAVPDPESPKKKKTPVSATKVGAPVRRKIPKVIQQVAGRKVQPEESSYTNDSENDEDDEDENDEVVATAGAVRGHSGTTVGVDDDSDDDESDLEDKSSTQEEETKKALPTGSHAAE